MRNSSKAKLATSETIAAIASGPGEAARGVLRLSGGDSREIASQVWDGPGLEDARGVFEGEFRDGAGRQPGLLIWMPGPRSFTREDVVEFHLPGSPFLLESALAQLIRLGARIAEPGEFTRRAFLNGRIDLARAEGILELIEARDRAERRSATALLFGGLSQRIEALRDELADLRSLCEASLDFDDSDTGHVEESELRGLFVSIRARLTEALQWESRRAAGLGLPRVVLAGAPNAGKSSLFNALCGERAIVSDHAGTTRDVLRAKWQVAGSFCELIDTAGLEDVDPDLVGTAGSERAELERALQRQASAARESADLCLWVADATRTDKPRGAPEASDLVVWNKCDQPAPNRHGGVRVSAKTGLGLEQLAREVAERLGLLASGVAPDGVGRGREITARHRSSLEQAGARLDEGREAWEGGAPLELFADSLRQASDELDGITGQTTPEDLLDRIFGRFCLGK